MREHRTLGTLDEIPYAGINQIRFRVGGSSSHSLSLAPQAPQAQMQDPRHSFHWPKRKSVVVDGQMPFLHKRVTGLIPNAPDFGPDGILAAPAPILTY